MIIVSGHIQVAPQQRDAYLTDCDEVVRLGRAADGCLDFALSADLIDPGRINILERWASREHLDAFRGAGTPEDQATEILSASVADYDATGEARL